LRVSPTQPFPVGRALKSLPNRGRFRGGINTLTFLKIAFEVQKYRPIFAHLFRMATDCEEIA
jgi:hypothetical protein